MRCFLNDCLRQKNKICNPFFKQRKWNIIYPKIMFPGGEKILTNNGNISNPHPNHTYTCVRENATEWHPEF